jgi:hypothetical protein
MLRQDAIGMRTRYSGIEDAAEKGPTVDHLGDISCCTSRSLPEKKTSPQEACGDVGLTA